MDDQLVRELMPKVRMLEKQLKDRDMERRVNALIPKAEEIAKKKAAKKKSEYENRSGKDRSRNKGEDYKHYWESEFFHIEMNRLAKAKGLRGW